MGIVRQHCLLSKESVISRMVRAKSVETDADPDAFAAVLLHRRIDVAVETSELIANGSRTLPS